MTATRPLAFARRDAKRKRRTGSGRAAAAGCTVLLFSLSLAACAKEPPAELRSEPALGETLFGSGYDISAPEGWSSSAPGLPSEVVGNEIDVIAAETEATDGFADNVNVLVSPMAELTADEAERLVVGELESGGFEAVTVEGRIMVADTESVHVSAIGRANGQMYMIEQYLIPVPDWNMYVVTFSFSPEVDNYYRELTAESVLASWTWF
jgi:hypothetical protein